MRTRLALVFALAACGESLPRSSLLQGTTDAAPAQREACELAEHKCSRCHTIGRVLSYPAITREDWEPVVHRMRRLPSSGITRTDAEVILHCLSRSR